MGSLNKNELHVLWQNCQWRPLHPGLQVVQRVNCLVLWYVYLEVRVLSQYDHRLHGMSQIFLEVNHLKNLGLCHLATPHHSSFVSILVSCICLVSLHAVHTKSKNKHGSKDKHRDKGVPVPESGTNASQFPA